MTTPLKADSRPSMLLPMTSSERRKAPRLPRLFLLALVSASLISFLGAEILWLSILSHFQLYFCAAWTAFLLLLHLLPRFRGAFWRPIRVTTVAGLFLLGHALFVASLWLPPHHPELELPQEVDLVWFNMKFDPGALRVLEQRLAADPPDILALGEIGPRTEVELPGYPFQLRSTKHKILIASRLPLELSDLVPVPGGGRDQLLTRVVVGRRRFRLVAVHIRQPVRPVHFQEILQVTATAKKYDDIILIGDFNTSPWGAPFRHLCRDGGLQHGSEGRGVHNTFALGSGRWIPLPIDHMFYKGAIDLKDFVLLDWTASDHRPLRATFLIGTKRGRKASGNR